MREVHACCVEICTYTVLCNVCAGFHVAYLHEIGVGKINTVHHLYVCDSQGEGFGEKRPVLVSKKVSLFTEDYSESIKNTCWYETSVYSTYIGNYNLSA